MTRIAGESPRTARYVKLSPPGTDDPIILCCELAGEGPPVVLVPGLGDTVWVWRRVTAVLEAGHRVCAVEPRGHGRSASPAGPYALAGLAGDLAGLAERLGLARPILIGHGLGAQAALALAIERPALPAGLVLIGAAAGPPEGEARRRLAERMAHAARGDMRAAYAARKAAGREPRGMSPRERAELHRIFLRNSPTGYAACCAAALEAPDLTGRLGEVRCPALALVGEFDPDLHDAVRALAAAIPRCDAAVVEEAGHYVQLDRPEAFRALLDDFLRRHNLSVLRSGPDAAR